jgi:hypothetical protein
MTNVFMIFNYINQAALAFHNFVLSKRLEAGLAQAV